MTPQEPTTAALKRALDRLEFSDQPEAAALAVGIAYRISDDAERIRAMWDGFKAGQAPARPGPPTPPG